MTNSDAHPVRSIIERLDALSDRDDVCLGDLIQAFGSTSFLPALMVPALLVVSPLSGIPLFSSICGLTIALVASQMILARDRIWLHRFLASRVISGERLHKDIGRLQKLADFVDYITRSRLHVLVTTPGNRLPYLMAFVAGLSMPVLELVPFSSSILGLCVLSCAVGLLARDGVFVLIGAGFMSVAAIIPYTVAAQIFGN